ncbi:mycothiol transferase [Pseudonocardia sp. TRM90224]|uniref:mycothiol transferase n=1 Tax=Pseudonocardia sp. TRM90224 TaxID=2812678 RepID=UPI001E39EFB7|nr:DUF664 domain-containing protein [Pseudonocardia sp. TRM90224]
MNGIDLLVDGLGRAKEVVHDAVDGLSTAELAERLDPEANSIAWLVWHLTRVQDDHIAEVAEQEQVWTSQGWAERFKLPFRPSATGYGQSSADVGQVQSSAELLLGYHDAVHAQSVAYLETIREDDLERIVDERWDPPVSLGVRLVSVVDDCAQHAGQAVFVRGVLLRRR